MDEEIPSSSPSSSSSSSSSSSLLSSLNKRDPNCTCSLDRDPSRIICITPDKNNDFNEEHEDDDVTRLLDNDNDDNQPYQQYHQHHHVPTTTPSDTVNNNSTQRTHEQQQQQEQKCRRGMLPKDMYSLLVTVPPGFRGFMLACATVFVQMIVLLLITIDSIDFSQVNNNNAQNEEYPTNWLHVPATSELQVTLAQCLALTIASLTQYDVVQAILLYVHGFNEQRFWECILHRNDSDDSNSNHDHNQRVSSDENVDHDNHDNSKYYYPHYLRVRWYVALIVRFGIGFASIIVTFLLVARSGTVRDVMLDFTAIEFVAQLDEVVFVLSTFGFFGRQVQRSTQFLIYDHRSLMYYFPPSSKQSTTAPKSSWKHRLLPYRRRLNHDNDDDDKNENVRANTNLPTRRANTIRTQSKGLRKIRKWTRTLLHIFLHTITFWVTIALLMIIVIRQYTGKYVPSTLLVQMGDARAPSLSTYSGLYDLQRPRLGSIQYMERGGDGLFTWCESERAWVFLEQNYTHEDCATAWTLKSTEMEQYADMLTIATEPWYIVEENNIRLETQHLRIFSMRGIQVNDCHNDMESVTKYGWTCRFSDPCPSIAVDAIAGPFQGQRTWPTVFDLFSSNDTDTLLVYRHPVYYSRAGSNRNPDLIIFTGRHWLMLSTALWLTTEEDEMDKIWTDDEIYDTLHHFRVYNFDRNLGVSFVSEVVDLGTRTDQGTPAGLQWFRAQAAGGNNDVNNKRLIPGIDARILVEQQFYCAVCNESKGRTCLFNAPCSDDGVCLCDGTNLGSRCEVVPSGNGVCNPTFNSPEFDFDGGDCCASTCVDSADLACLKSRDQLIDYGNSLCRNRQSIFQRRLSLTQPDFVGEWPNAVSAAPGISLTPDGRSFALSYRLIEQMRLISQVGNSWTSSGIGHAYGGYYNEISSLFLGSVGGPVRRLPVKGVAASFVSRGISAYICDGLGCDLGYFVDPNTTVLENTVVPAEFTLADYWDPFSLSSDGSVLARGDYEPDAGRYFVKIYTAESALVWNFFGQQVDISVNRTKVVGSYFVPVVPATLHDDDSNTTSTLTLSQYTNSTNGTLSTCEFLAERLGLTISDWSNISLINNLPLFDLGDLTTDEFLSSVSDFNETDFNITQFNVTEYIMEECLPDLVEVFITETEASESEAPIYLSLSGLRPDGVRRLAVGSIMFKNRTADALTNSLATRVYDITPYGRIDMDNVVVLDQSDRHGKSSSDALGIPKKAVVISDDGNTLVVGSLYIQKDEFGTSVESAIVKIFHWTIKGWNTVQEIELGRNDTTPQVRDGWSNALSADGTVLAVAFPSKSAVYRWNGTHYDLNSAQMLFAPGTDCTVSLNGGTVGFAAPLRGGFGVFMYRNDRAPWCSEQWKREMRISYTPLFPQNFTWKLFAPVSVSGEEEGEVVDIIETGGWPNSTSIGGPLSERNLMTRGLQLDVESDYELDDPSGLTFVYTLCVDIDACGDVYRDEQVDLPGTLGLIFDGRRVEPFSDKGDEPKCRLEFSTSLA